MEVNKIFSKRYEGRMQVVGTGWLLGSFRWSYNNGGAYGGSDREDDQLTVLIDKLHYSNLLKSHADFTTFQ